MYRETNMLIWEMSIFHHLTEEIVLAIGASNEGRIETNNAAATIKTLKYFYIKQKGFFSLKSS